MAQRRDTDIAGGGTLDDNTTVFLVLGEGRDARCCIRQNFDLRNLWTTNCRGTIGRQPVDIYIVIIFS